MNLNELKVKSFITNYEDKMFETLKAKGGQYTFGCSLILCSYPCGELNKFHRGGRLEKTTTAFLVTT